MKTEQKDIKCAASDQVPCYADWDANWDVMMICPHCGDATAWDGKENQHCGECTGIFTALKGPDEAANLAKVIFNGGYISEGEIAGIIRGFLSS